MPAPLAGQDQHHVLRHLAVCRPHRLEVAVRLQDQVAEAEGRVELRGGRHVGASEGDVVDALHPRLARQCLPDPRPLDSCRNQIQAGR